jgi:hypothetical protein
VCSVEVGFVRALVEYVPDDAFDGGVEFVAGEAIDFGDGVGVGRGQHNVWWVQVEVGID